jgi:uncharacterized protein (DUF1501 family)
MAKTPRMSDEERRRQDAEAKRTIICADCARSDSLAHDLEPVDRMPIPSEAVAGFPDGVPKAKRYDRRSFLKWGVLGMASVYAAAKIDWQQAFESAVAEGAVPGSVLVCLYLNGGLDGLHLVVPTGTEYATYQQKRPNLARTLGPSVAGGAVGTTPIPGTNGQLGWANVAVAGTGNNNDTRGMDTIFGPGGGAPGADLAIFPAADYTPPNLSHFDSRDYWFAGALQKLQTGWLGRWLDVYGSQTNPLQAVSIDSSLSKQIRTVKAPVSAVASLGGVNFQLDNNGGINATNEMSNLADNPVTPGNEHLARTRGAYGLTVQVSRALGGLAAPNPAAGGYPQSDLSRKLQIAATLISAGLGTRVITIDWGSFDSHGNQVGSVDPQLITLSRALAAFKADLAARGVEQNVVTLIFTEFGRRIASNESGTDHGAGGPMMVMGSSVFGGIAADHPGVSAPDRNGDLRVTTDFRSVYQAVIAEWLGGDPGAVLPGGPFPALATPLIG